MGSTTLYWIFILYSINTERSENFFQSHFTHDLKETYTNIKCHSFKSTIFSLSNTTDPKLCKNDIKTVDALFFKDFIYYKQ